MVRNIHFGGALPGIASSRFSQSMAGIFGPRHLAKHAQHGEHRGDRNYLFDEPIVIRPDRCQQSGKSRTPGVLRPCPDPSVRRMPEANRR